MVNIYLYVLPVYIYVDFTVTQVFCNRNKRILTIGYGIIVFDLIRQSADQRGSWYSQHREEK